MDKFNSEKDDKFNIYRENIPSFESTLNPITKSMNNVKVLLEEIANTRKNIIEPCGEICMSCSTDQLNKFLGFECKLSTTAGKPESSQVQQTSSPVEPKETKNNDSTEERNENVNRHVQKISEQEFKTIPKYQLGRLTLENLNEIVSKMEEFLSKKNQILSKTNKQLTRSDREMLDNWRELELKAKKRLPTTLFFIENDIRPLLTERLRPSFSKSIPCLRHIRRVREERCGPLTFYYA